MDCFKRPCLLKEIAVRQSFPDLGQRIISGMMGLSFLSLALLVFAFFAPAHVHAAERAWIASDGVLSYSEGSWIGIGGVRLVQGGTEITAERMRYDPEAEVALFTGDVVVVEDGDRLLGDAFRYDLSKGAGELTDAFAILEVEAITDPIYLLGDTLAFDPHSIVVSDARLTTCVPPQNPGYYLQSRRIDVFPGDRVVIRNVRFVESGIPLFYWPYVVLSLRPDRPSRINFPEIGHNSRDGWYVKTRFAYDGPGDGYGEALFDVYQLRGIGIGVEHTYRDRLDTDSVGEASAYRLTDWSGRQTELSLGIEETFPLSPRLQAALVANYLEEEHELGYPQYKGEMGAGLDYNFGSTSTRWEWTGQRFWGSDETGSVDRHRFDHRSSPLGWRWRLRGETFAQEGLGYTARQELDYRSQLTRTGYGYRLGIEFERRLHSSRLRVGDPTPAWRVREKSPQVDFRLDLSRHLSRWLPFELVLGYARLHEERRISGEYENVRADRYTTGFQLVPNSLSLGVFGRLYFRAGMERHTYSTGEEHWVLTANHQLRSTLGERWSFYGNYTYRETIGDDPPFEFESVVPMERVNGRLQYTLPYGSVSLQTGYDFQNAVMSDVIGQMSLRPREGHYTMSVQGGYSLEDQAPTYAAARVTVHPSDRWHASTSARYDFGNALWDRVDTSLALALTGWRFAYSSVFDGRTGEFDQGTLGVVRDLGCREIGLSFDHVESEVWLEYRITALPGEGVRVGTRGEGIRFDTDSFLDLF